MYQILKFFLISHALAPARTIQHVNSCEPSFTTTLHLAVLAGVTRAREDNNSACFWCCSSTWYLEDKRKTHTYVF